MKQLKIQISAIALQKLWLWTDLAKGEVAAFGLVDELPGILRVTDFLLIDQQCNCAETEMDQQALAELILQLEDPAKLRCWAHSHAFLEVFWSKTDNATIEGLSNEWFLSLVVNKDHEALLRLDQFHPKHMYLDDMPWEAYCEIDEAILIKEFKQKVKESAIPLLPVTEEEMAFWEDYDEFR